MPHYKAFIKMLKENKESIFHPEDMPTKLVGPIHALSLQLLSRGIIELTVSDETKIGTMALNSKLAMITLPNAEHNGVTLPAYTI